MGVGVVVVVVVGVVVVVVVGVGVVAVVVVVPVVVVPVVVVFSGEPQAEVSASEAMAVPPANRLASLRNRRLVTCCGSCDSRFSPCLPLSFLGILLPPR
jgi:hypothetical protein